MAARTEALLAIDVNSGRLWLAHEWRRGTMSHTDALRYVGWLVAYRWGQVDFERALAHTLALVRGRDEQAMRRDFASWCARELVPRICPAARRAIAEHRERGHVVALLTTGSQFSARPVADALGIEHLLCTELEVVGGKLTGHHRPPACYAGGKIMHAEQFAQREGLDLDASFFYTDSHSDRPMLERVGHPRVINPDRQLKKLARSRGWPLEIWRAG